MRSTVPQRQTASSGRRRHPGASAVLLAAAVGAAALVTCPGPVSHAATTAGTPAVSSGQSLRQVSPVGATTAWAWTAGSTAQGLELTTDGGQHWANVTPPGLGQPTGSKVIGVLDALSGQRAWVSYGAVTSDAPQTIATTADGGQHWTVVGHDPGTAGCAIDFVTATDGWCSALEGAAGSMTVTLYRTQNGGQSWSLVSRTGPSSHTPGALPFRCDKALQLTGPDVGWAAFGCNGGLAPLYESTNGGKTWVRRSLATFSGPTCCGSAVTSFPVLSGRNGAFGYTRYGDRTAKTVVYVTKDAGQSWRPVTPPGQAQDWIVDPLGPGTWRLVAGQHILATSNAGQTWRSITSNTSFSSSAAVDFVTTTTGWITNRSGSGALSLWRSTDGGSSWRHVPVPGT